MISYLIIFLVAASIAAALTPVCRWLSIYIGAVDEPDDRKVHRSPMPRMGGLAIVVAFLLPVATLMVFYRSASKAIVYDNTQIGALFIGGIVIALLGAIDDTIGLKARIKFLVQFAVAVSAWFVGFRFEYIGLPILGPVALPLWIDSILTVLWIVGVVNAINLIDGLDGLAAGVTFFVAATNLVLALQTGNELGALFSATIAGAVIGFLLFNWNPAIVFMGDTGSMFIGYILATTSIMTSQKVSTAVAMIVPLVALGVPVIDTLMSIIRRFLEKRPLFSPDKGHLHHRLLRYGLTQRRAVLAIYSICVIFAVTAIAITTAARDVEAAVAMGVLAIVVIGIVRFFGFFNVHKAVQSTLRRNQLAERLRPHFPEFSATATSADASLDDLWKAIVALCEKSGISEVSWQTAGIRPPESRRHYSNPAVLGKAASTRFFGATTSSHIDRGSYVEIKVFYPASLGKENDELKTLLSVICDLVAVGMKNISSRGEWDHSAICSPENPVQEEAKRQLKKNEEPGATLEKGDGNPAFDAAWEQFTKMCREHEFSGAAWATFGVQPVDRREMRFDGNNVRELAVIRRSLPITPITFMELRFTYPGREGKKAPTAIRKAAKDICLKIGREIRKLV